MSGGAVRTPSTRRHTRNNNASPYARPSASKSSGWSLTGILNYLNPFNTSSEQERASPPPEGEAASRLAARGQQLLIEPNITENYNISPGKQRHAQPPPPPPRNQLPTQTTSPSPPAVLTNGGHRVSPRSDNSSSSSVENIKKIRQFLDEKEGQGQSLNAIEVAGLVHLLQNSVEDFDESEPFRFSRSPSATPMRSMTPANMFSPSGVDRPAGDGTQSVPKTLAKNPMGVYHWRGGGSARPRNRYQSPNFGSNSTRTTIKLQPEKRKADTKRRRVGEEATASSPQRAGTSTVSKANIMSSAASAANSASAASNGISISRANGGPPPVTPGNRTVGVKLSTPAKPSPLRQTWGQTDSPTQSQVKPTRAASFMAELIKEVTPPKKPDFVNPYEAANPIIKPPPKKQPVRKARLVASMRDDPKKGLELTPQAIIEATVPKGSKRSRPPPELIGVKSPEILPDSARRSTRLNGMESKFKVDSASKAPTVEGVPAEEQPSPPKKQRTLADPAPMRTVVIEEVDDVEMSAPTRSVQPSYTLPSEIIEPGDEKSDKRATSPTSTFPNIAAVARGVKSSAPKAPSKLRFSIQVDREEKAVAASVPNASSFSIPQPSIAASQPKAPMTPKKPMDVRAYVATMRQDELPVYTFALPLSSPGAGPSTPRVREIAKTAPVSSLPTYDLIKAPAPPPVAKQTSGFDWSAAGLQPPKATGESWQCSVCMLQNTTAGDKCTVCDAPRPDKPKPTAATGGFNWAAAGIKPPPKPAGGQWTCSVCMLSNPSTAAKCTVCDASR